MGKFIDLTGKKFGRLTVVKREGTDKNKQILWLCKCDCGNYKVVRRGHLKKGGIKSCGCLRKETAPKNTFKDLTGATFGKLFVIKRVGSRKRKGTRGMSATWMCRCECGVEIEMTTSQLLSGKTKSCGCLHIQRITKHGFSSSKIFRAWSNMKQRCYNPNNPMYRWWGAKGVKVCDAWLNNFESFYKWSIENGYREDLTIDRINPFGNYEPSNCRWITLSEQAYNKRDSECNKHLKEEYLKEHNVLY